MSEYTEIKADLELSERIIEVIKEEGDIVGPDIVEKIESIRVLIDIIEKQREAIKELEDTLKTCNDAYNGEDMVDLATEICLMLSLCIKTLKLTEE